MHRKTLSAGTLIGDEVVNLKSEKIGKVEEIMLDTTSGNVAYVVLSFGGFLGIGDKLFALPWRALRVDESAKEVVVDIDKNRLEKAPGFDKDHWPDFSDSDYSRSVDSYYA